MSQYPRNLNKKPLLCKTYLTSIGSSMDYEVIYFLILFSLLLHQRVHLWITEIHRSSILAWGMRQAHILMVIVKQNECIQSGRFFGQINPVENIIKYKCLAYAGAARLKT